MSVGATLAAPAVSLADGKLDPRPNILVVMADDLGKEGLAIYGNPTHSTPNLDRLASEGQVFTRFFSSCNCSPSRASFLTGLYPPQHGLERVLGVDKRRGHLDTALPNLARTLAAAGYLTATAGKWHLADLRRHPLHPYEIGFERYCVWHREQQKANGKAHYRYLRPLYIEDGEVKQSDRFAPDLYADYLISLMGTARPWFMVYNALLPHLPFVDPVSATKGGRQDFAAMVSYLDGILGLLLAAVLENTIVVFTSDNGSDQRVGGGKGTLTDLGTNVPLVVRGLDRGVDHRLCDLTDLYPTIAGWAGTEADPLIDGRALSAPEREAVFIWCAPNKGKKHWAIRGERYRLHDNGRLYDLAAGEQRSVRNPSERAILRAVYERL